MIYRNIFPILEQNIDSKLITVITGLRRVGKTSAIKYLMDKIESTNKLFLDLEKAENRFLFKQGNYKDIEISLQIEGIDFSQKAWIALDEIQLVPEITSVIKYLYDNYDINFLVTGSSSFYIKNHFNESLAGRKRIFEMHTLSFDEFLRFKEIDFPLNDYKWGKYNIALHSKLSHYYDEYLTYGGFPEVVQTKRNEDKIAYLKEIINAYLQMDLLIAADIKKTDEIYALIMLLSTRTGSKTDFSKLSSLTGINRLKLKEYISFLEYTFFIYQIQPFVHNLDREIALQKKLYFADNGILTAFKITDKSKLLENSICNQLMNYEKEVNYYARKTGQEIDFIFDKSIAIEVKETPTALDLKILTNRSRTIGIEKNIVTGLNPPLNGFVDFTSAFQL